MGGISLSGIRLRVSSAAVSPVVTAIPCKAVPMCAISGPEAGPDILPQSVASEHP
jgi:hypothetical protein